MKLTDDAQLVELFGVVKCFGVGDCTQACRTAISKGDDMSLPIVLCFSKEFVVSFKCQPNSSPMCRVLPERCQHQAPETGKLQGTIVVVNWVEKKPRLIRSTSSDLVTVTGTHDLSG